MIRLQRNRGMMLQAVSWPSGVRSLITSRRMKQIKCLELILVVELACGGYLKGAVNMKSEELSMQVKMAKKQNKSM